MKDKSIFNISIIELILILLFMYMTITVYQLSFKSSHIEELNQIVESQRELTQELAKKEYPKIENKIADLVNLEKYKRMNHDLQKNNSGVFYIENKIIGNLNDASKLKDYNKFEKLQKEKAKLHTQILELKGNTLTINTLNELNIQNEPLHRQIQFLERKVRDNYQNKLTLANKLKDLKTNETVKYILLKLNKFDAPIHEQLEAINNELGKFDKSYVINKYNLEKNYNTNTKYILKNLNHENKPLEAQIKLLKQTLENQKLINKIKMLEGKQYQLNQKSGKYSVDTNNVQKALKNLQELKKDISGKYETNTKDILRKLEQNNKPLDDQIYNLKKELELTQKVRDLENKLKNLQKQLDINKDIKNPNLKREDIKRALENLQELKKNIEGKYEPNTKDILRELKQEKAPLDKQISELEKQFDLDQKAKELENKLNDLQKELNINKEIKNPNVKSDDIKRALENLQELKKDVKGELDPKTKDMLRELKQENKPLDEQIAELKKQLDLDQKAKDIEKNIENIQKQIADTKKLKNPKVKPKDLQKALDNLQELKKDIKGEYKPKTKELLRELKQENKPLDEQISELKKQLNINPKINEIENKIKDLQKQLDLNKKLKNPNVNNENIQKALDNLQELKKDINSELEPNTKELLKELKQTNKPLDEQIRNLKKELENTNQNKDIKDRIKELKKQLGDKNLDSKNIESDKIKKAIDDLEKIKKNNVIEYEPTTKEILKELKQDSKPLKDQIKELKKQLEKASKNDDLEDVLKDLKKQIDDNKKLKDSNINSADLQKALDNLQKQKTNTNTKYEPNTKEVLKQLKQSTKPINEQISEIKKELANGKVGKDLEKRLKELQKELEKTKDTNKPQISQDKIQEALKNLKDFKNKKVEKLSPNTKEVLEKLKQTNKPLDEQINELKKQIDSNKKAKDLEDKMKDIQNQIAKNKEQRGSNLDNKKLQKALDNLVELKKNTTDKNDPKLKEILKKLGQSDKPINDQISEVKRQIAVDKKAKDLENKIKDIQRQIAKNKEKVNPNINSEKLQKALNNLESIKDKEDAKAADEKLYKYKLKDALDGVKEIQKIKDKLDASNKDYKPKINQDIEQTIKYLEDKAKDADLKPSTNVQKILDKYKIKDEATPDQLSDLYLNLYSKPVDNINISELNFVINRLNDQNDLENRIDRINEVIKDINRPRNSFVEQYVNGPAGSNNEIRTLKNQIKYLQKKIEKSGKLHLPCILDDDGKTLYLFKLFLREDNIHVQMGWQEGVAQIAKGLPNLDKLVDKTLSLSEFMELTKPIFEKSVKDECRQFVYFEDETISKKEYKRKTLTIQHHFYKYIEATW